MLVTKVSFQCNLGNIGETGDIDGGQKDALPGGANIKQNSQNFPMQNKQG